MSKRMADDLCDDDWQPSSRHNQTAPGLPAACAQRKALASQKRRLRREVLKGKPGRAFSGGSFPLFRASSEVSDFTVDSHGAPADYNSQILQLQRKNFCLQNRLDMCEQQTATMAEQLQRYEAQWAASSRPSQDQLSCPVKTSPVDLGKIRSRGPAASGSSEDVSEVELALWEASNRPVRPADWATTAEAARSAPSSSCATTYGSLPMAHLDHERLSPVVREAGLEHSGAPTVTIRDNIIKDHTDVDLLLHVDVLPDVPGGTQSVDLLAVHIPLGPWHGLDHAYHAI